jgi:hypothetical protein
MVVAGVVPAHYLQGRADMQYMLMVYTEEGG